MAIRLTVETPSQSSECRESSSQALFSLMLFRGYTNGAIQISGIGG
jgi:hypothetical protein